MLLAAAAIRLETVDTDNDMYITHHKWSAKQQLGVAAM